MAIKPKGNKVNGTKKNDKINWSNTKPWKKSLTVYGLNGNDTIYFKKSKYKNKLNGGNGNDKIWGGTNIDTIYGNSGNDYIYGMNGSDKIYGGTGKDTIKGGSGNDKIWGGDGNDKLYGESGNDTIYGDKGNDSIDGGYGNDKIYGKYGTNTLKGGAGNDSIYGGTGTDKIWASYGNDSIDGGSGNDIIYGESGSNTLKGGAGNDTIYGGFDNDNIDGGTGDDSIFGGEGNNTLNGGDGDDTITASAGTNLINAGTGTNEIHLSNYIPEDNVIVSGDGVDTLFLDNQTTFNGLGASYVGDDLVISNFGNVILQNYKNIDHSVKYISINGEVKSIDDIFCERIGSDEGDSITGGDGSDMITGGLGNDTINAGGGVNSICYSLGDGNDTIQNGGGIDTLVFDEGTKVATQRSGDNLIITYSGIVNDSSVSNTISVTDYYTTENHSVQFIKIGNKTYAITDFHSLTRGADALTDLTVTKDSSIVLTLTNPFGGANYQYTITTDTTDAQNFDVQYLINGRLAISGNHLQITANYNQADDILLWGDYNHVETADGDDIVRLGGAIDGVTYDQSDNNIINTGSGNDYVTYLGGYNTINTGDDTDAVTSLAPDAPGNNVSGAEYNRNYYANEPSSSINGSISTFSQGDAGDCRVLSIIESLSIKGTFADAVSIVDNGNNTYTVTFNNYHPEGEKVNYTTFAKSDLTDFNNVYGDLDVVLTDFAINKLLEENGDSDFIADMSYAETATYNTLANYFYGNDKMAAAFYDSSVVGLSYNYRDRVETLWGLYKNGTINNISVAFTCDDDFDLGIISGHAYTIKNIDTENSYISLINVWDNQDILNLDLDMFYSLEGNVYVYGYKYGTEDFVINNVQIASAKTDYNEIFRYNSVGNSSDIAVLTETTASWTSNTNDLIAEAQANNDYTNTPQELIAAYWTNNSIA